MGYYLAEKYFEEHGVRIDDVTNLVRTAPKMYLRDFFCDILDLPRTATTEEMCGTLTKKVQ